MTEVAGKTSLIRADASTHIGSGHVMRCLALAQAWQDAGGRVIFAMAMPAPALEARLRKEGVELVHLPTQPGSADDARQTADLARWTEASAVVVDGYHFDAEYQRRIEDSGLQLLFIDDYGHAGYHRADLVLNQNIHAHSGFYVGRASHTQLLLGTRYVVLRREFLKWRNWERDIPGVARRVLVTLGGGDPDNATLKVIHALQQAQIDGLEAVIVAGGSNPHYKALASAIQNSQVPVDLKSNVNNMPDLMAWADVAISAGGSTCWELAFMGLPNLILILAANQRLIAEGLDNAKAAISLGYNADVSVNKIRRAMTQLSADPVTRFGMAKCGRKLVNGDGSSRVIRALAETVRLSNANTLSRK